MADSHWNIKNYSCFWPLRWSPVICSWPYVSGYGYMNVVEPNAANPKLKEFDDARDFVDFLVSGTNAMAVIVGIRADGPCKTCRWPKHSWATIPASIHTSRTNTGPDGTFTDADVEDMVKFPLITMEKWQGTDATDASGKRVFIWEEDAWINSAKKLKAKNPDVSVEIQRLPCFKMLLIC